MTLKYYCVNNQFRYPFTISKGSKTHQAALIIELEFMGIKGYGEAPAIAYYNITTEKLVDDINVKKTIIEKFALTDPERYWHFLHHLFPANPFLVCAFDMAGWDLFAKLKRKKCYQLWGSTLDKVPITDYTIGIDTIEKMVEKIKEFSWPIYKIKLGTDEDIRIIIELRKHTTAAFRIDANAAWEPDEALQKINAFKNLNVQLIEQPLDKENWEGMKYLFEKSELPLFADESCVGESDVEKCHNYFHGINIKLTKCGGITPARRMITKAKNLGMKIMLGTMNETSIGSAAIAQLAPQADFLDMDGPLLLAKDIATSIQYENGKIIYADADGLGISAVSF